jgi:hypothetical protein
MSSGGNAAADAFVPFLCVVGFHHARYVYLMLNGNVKNKTLCLNEF